MRGKKIRRREHSNGSDQKTSSNGMQNSCDASCITLATSFLRNGLNVALIIALHSVHAVCCHCHAKEKLFLLFRMARKFNYIPFEKETKNVFFSFVAHISHEEYRKVYSTTAMTMTMRANEIFLILFSSDFM